MPEIKKLYIDNKLIFIIIISFFLILDENGRGLYTAGYLYLSVFKISLSLQIFQSL